MAERTININEDFHLLNSWVQKSIELFNSGHYLDKIAEIYNYQADRPVRIEDNLRREIRVAHNNRKDEELIQLLSHLDKFPYDEPFWFLLKKVPGFIDNTLNKYIELRVPSTV